jgi:hypothetical protein
MTVPRPLPAGRLASLAALAALTALAAGCGKSSGTISGKVTYQGKPLPYGSVQFISASGLALVGVIESDGSGSYSIPNVPVGKAQISVTCQDPKYADFMKQLSASARDKSIPRPKGSPDQFNLIPGKYFDPSTSGLSCEVKGGQQTHDITLTD